MGGGGQGAMATQPKAIKPILNNTITGVCMPHPQTCVPMPMPTPRPVQAHTITVCPAFHRALTWSPLQV